jgi:hypothetical protein
VAYAYNPSNLGSRDQEDHSSKSAQENNSRDPISKIPNTKKGLVEWLKWYSACLANMRYSSNPSTKKPKL